MAGTNISNLTSEALAALIELAGRWAEVEGMITDLENDLDGYKTSNNSRSDLIENDISNLKDTDLSHATTLSSHNGRLGSLESRMGNAETDISGIKSLNTTQNTRLDDHDSSISALNTALSLLIARVTNLETWKTQQEAINTQVQIKLDDLQAQIDNIVDAGSGGSIGVLYQSPSGTLYRFTVDDTGNAVTTEEVAP